MNISWRWTWGAGAAGAVLAMTLTVSAQTSTKPKDAAAIIDDEVVSMAEIERSSAIELQRLEEQRHRVLNRKLDEIIADRLLAREAKRRGVSVEELLRAEVTAKTPAVTGEDVDAFIAQNRARLPRSADESLKVRITDYLHRRQVDQRREAFLASLRAQTSIQVYLKAPEPLRLSVDGKVGFSRGSDDAPVVIVEFSDFQCPFCKDVVPTLKELTTKYSGRVRWVFRDYPIATLHPDAPTVHEAARCAGEQGKFWLYHDLVFEKAPAASLAALRAYAAEVGLEAAAFGQCLDSRKHRSAVDADIEAGKNLGVTGTPTFFINGALFVGNQPLAEFQRVIERELARTASAR